MKRIIRKQHILAVILALCIFLQAGYPVAAQENSSDTSVSQKIDKELPLTQGNSAVCLSGNSMDFERVSPTDIHIAWIDNTNLPVQYYVVQKRGTQNNVGIGQWNNVGIVDASQTVPDQCVSFIDHLDSPAPQQFEYRIVLDGVNPAGYSMPEKTSILASNVLVCLDPGHFSGRNSISGAYAYNYNEGDYTLKIAASLYAILKKEYGIDACLTRTTESITLGGYTDAALDDAHVALRGRYAGERGCNLFVSLHTDANGENANGYPTAQQPKSVNKTFVIVNTLAINSEIALKAANSLGVGLMKLNYRLGLSSHTNFNIAGVGVVLPWTETHHDYPNVPGSVYYRTNDNGRDYYGVLRGSADVGVPGMIIEHAFHTVPEVRREAMQTNLYYKWAQIDAYGIAYGFGFVDEILYNAQ